MGVWALTNNFEVIHEVLLNSVYKTPKVSCEIVKLRVHCKHHSRRQQFLKILKLQFDCFFVFFSDSIVISVTLHNERQMWNCTCKVLVEMRHENQQFCCCNLDCNLMIKAKRPSFYIIFQQLWQYPRQTIPIIIILIYENFKCIIR